MNETGKEFEKELAAKAEELDTLPVEIPPMTHFTAMVRAENKKVKTSQRRQFAAFLLVALLALLALTAIWNLYQTVFFVVEGVLLGASVLAAVYSLVRMVRVRSRQ